MYSLFLYPKGGYTMTRRLLALMLCIVTLLNICTGLAAASDSVEAALGEVDIYNGGYELG